MPDHPSLPGPASPGRREASPPAWRHRRRAGLGVAVAGTVLAGLLVVAPVASSAQPTASVGAASGGGAPSGTAPACPGPAAPTDAACHAIVLDNPAAWQGQHIASSKSNGHSPGPSTSTPSGYAPCDLESAYGLSSSSPCAQLGSSTKTVAIVDAYDDPNAASDLAVYRSEYGLPPVTFTKAYASGTKPSNNTGWAEEISLDLDMVSAICANCNILLEEAASNSYANLAAAFRKAASTAGVVAVSNSYGGSDSSSDSTFDGSSYYNFAAYSGLAITASSGDGGYGVEYPASSQYVTAVGGTTLTSSSSTWTETVWSGAGSGCSKYEPNPGWQPKTSLCSGRTVADVSADANPNTGVAVYDTDGEPGWMVFGGTSVASPIIASVYALAAQHSPSALYGDTALRKILSGSNSRRCSSYLCNAAYSLGSSGNKLTWSGPATWYNGPTGNGTPQGTSSF